MYPRPPRNETWPRLIDRYPTARIPRMTRMPTAMLTRVRSIGFLRACQSCSGWPIFRLAPDEPLDHGVGRGLDRRGRPDLHDTALVEHGHRVGNLEDLGDLVAHDHGCEPKPPV